MKFVRNRLRVDGRTHLDGTIHMFSPGTISMREETFRMMLEDTARSQRKSTGFKNIIFIGDSGRNHAGMKAVAEKLNAEWPDNAEHADR
jgi:creatinine amidohydrolase/Fe(II)-dependent formamide hydrolase-like protein